MAFREFDLARKSYSPFRGQDGKADHVTRMDRAEENTPRSLEVRYKINQLFKGMTNVAHGAIDLISGSERKAA